MIDKHNIEYATKIQDSFQALFEIACKISEVNSIIFYQMYIVVILSQLNKIWEYP